MDIMHPGPEPPFWANFSPNPREVPEVEPKTELDETASDPVTTVLLDIRAGKFDFKPDATEDLALQALQHLREGTTDAAHEVNKDKEK